MWSLFKKIFKKPIEVIWTEKYEWCKPNDIKYTQAQVKWLISVLPLLRQGVYPRNPKETGYIDRPLSQQRFNNKARFIVAAEIAAELDLRIQRAGLDGILLEFVYSSDTEDVMTLENHIANAMHLDINTVDRRIHNALKYVSGKQRKDRDYKRFRQHKKANRK